MYEPSECTAYDSDGSDGGGDAAALWPCCAALTRGHHRGRQKRNKKHFGGGTKRTYGMMASDVNDEEKVLPGLKALVANYARMLYEERAQFVETLFRAVKLNKVGINRSTQRTEICWSKLHVSSHKVLEILSFNYYNVYRIHHLGFNITAFESLACLII